MRAILDTGALIAVDRRDKRLLSVLVELRRRGFTMRTPVGAVAQVWRDGSRQASLARFLGTVEEVPFHADDARRAGRLLQQSGTKDVIDASVALLATTNDTVLTSDRADIEHLMKVLGNKAVVVRC